MSKNSYLKPKKWKRWNELLDSWFFSHQVLKPFEITRNGLKIDFEYNSFLATILKATSKVAENLTDFRIWKKKALCILILPWFVNRLWSEHYVAPLDASDEKITIEYILRY